MLLQPAVGESAHKQIGQPLQWEQLARFPQADACRGAFLGTGGDALILAGGIRRPSGVWVLSSPGAEWSQVARLPRALVHGTSVTDYRGLICIGGSDLARHYPTVLRIEYDGHDTQFIRLPDLPRPLAFSSAALVERTIYVAGGTAKPKADEPLDAFWALDLTADDTDLAWTQLPSWPGPARGLAVAVAQDGAFFMFGGVTFGQRERGDKSADTRRPRALRDAYRYRPAAKRWNKIADLPDDVAGSPVCAFPLGPSHIAVLLGDQAEARLAGADPIEEYPTRHLSMVCYHTITDTWVRVRGDYRETLAAAGMSGRLIATVWQADSVRYPVLLGDARGSVLLGEPKKIVQGIDWRDYIALAGYLIVLIGIGAYFARREKSTADFFLGGRRIPWWAAGLSIFGTQLSAITFMAIPAVVYRTDWVYFLGALTLTAMAPVVVFLYLPFYRRLEITSVYEYLEQRFNLAARLLGSAAFLLYQLGRMGVVLYLPSLALSAVTGVNIYLCIAAMGILATCYTVLGGIEAVIWTDVLQVVVLLGGALLSLVLIVSEVDGGVSGIISTAGAEGKLRAVNLTWDVTTTALWLVLFGRAMEQLIPYTADQTVVQRYLTTADQRTAARGIWTNALISVPALALFFCVGTALWAFYRTRPELLNPLGRTDEIFPWFIAGQLPPGVVGLVIAGLFAAAMSSLDSSMNSMATVITTDFYRRFRPNCPDRTVLRLARALIVLLGTVGIACASTMAYLQSESMFDQYTKIIGLFGGGLAGLFAVGICTRRTHGPGAIVGFLVSAAILFATQALTDVHFFLYPAIGIVSCFTIGYTVSRIFPMKQGDLDGLTVR